MKNLKNFALLLLFVCIGGGASLLFGQDVSFDLQNYHLYIPYAFLNGRWAIDIIPAGALHSFFNPLLDIPAFLMYYHLNDWPHLTAFLLGGFYGIFLFIIWKLIPLIFEDQDSKNILFRIIVLCFAASGMATLLQIARSSNEIQTSLLGLLACWFLFKGTNQKLNFRLGYLMAAAFVVSLAAGFKYTAAPSMLGIGLACLFVLIKSKASWKNYAWVILSAVVGILLADGFFMWHKFQTVQNPLFPYFNHIFQSPYFNQDFLPNGMGTPQNWKEWLFLPFLRYQFRILEYRLDFRLILGLVSFWVLLTTSFFSKKEEWYKPSVLLLCVFCNTYIGWVLLFGNMRYVVFLEVISSLLFVLLMRRFISARFTTLIVALVALGLNAQPLPEWHRQIFAEKNIVFTQEPNIPDNSFVLIGGHLSFLVPFLNPNARYAGGIWFPPEEFAQRPSGDGIILNWLQRNDYKHNFAPIIVEEMKKHEGPVYILIPSEKWLLDNNFWSKYSIRVDENPNKCQYFQVSLDAIYNGFYICEVQKIS
ncbi:MAG: hypothetical protein IKL48_05910 [Elusimicrobiaceae bacterium]|nr:hypothetical protein [Elusimicrobiaceae bacterium]